MDSVRAYPALMGKNVRFHNEIAGFIERSGQTQEALAVGHRISDAPGGGNCR